jgi:excisionase family DNA binding protein
MDRWKPVQITLGEAARQIGVAKGTISKAIKTGKLSATRREDGSWSIDNAELARYLDANGHRFRSETVSGEQLEIQPKTDLATDALVAELRAVIADLRSDRDHLREDMKRWREVAERLSLPAQKPTEQPSLWRWLRSRA